MRLYDPEHQKLYIGERHQFYGKITLALKGGWYIVPESWTLSKIKALGSSKKRTLKSTSKDTKR